MKPIIVAKDLHKRYAGFAPVLRGVNLEVYPGELVAIMGPSGCGKSTMLHILGLLHSPDSGTLTIMDKNVLAFNREQTAAFRRGNLGFVMQASNLFDHSTVFENVEFPLIYEKVPPAERWPRVIRALELVRLTSRVHYPSNRLSGGEQQRVAIARAMVNNPRILMADEPTGALDQRTSRLIMENFRTLCHSGGVALVMVTHDAKMADYCDSIYTLEEGLLVCQRHNVPEIHSDGVSKILNGPDMRLSMAMISEDFLKPGGEAFRAEAHLLHHEGLLSHVVTLASGGLLGKDMESYSLPMPVRHLGGIHALPVLASWFGFIGNPKPKDTSYRKIFPKVAALAGGSWLKAQASYTAHCARESHVQCLYSAGGPRAAVLSWLASRIAEVPYAFDLRTLHGWMEDAGRKDAAAKKRIDALAVLLKDAVFARCDTKALRDALAGALAPESAAKLVFVPDPLTLSPMDEELSAAQSREKRMAVHFLCVGSMEKRKGFGTVLRAAARLKSVGRLLHVTMVGGGPELNSLKRQAHQLGISDQVTFTGPVHHENMTAIYLDADVFLSPGVALPGVPPDGIPSALTEAMSFFLPPVVTDLPGSTWLVENGISGQVVPQNDEARLADAMEKFITDSEYRTRMGREASLRVRKCLAPDEKALTGLFQPILGDRAPKSSQP